MYLKSLPLAASVALYAANETLKKHGVFEQPEIFLESHQRRRSEEIRGTVFVFLTKYTPFALASKRTRIKVVTRLERKRAWWFLDEDAVGTVRVEVTNGKVVTTVEESFRMVWTNQPNLLKGQIRRYPKVVFDR